MEILRLFLLASIVIAGASVAAEDHPDCEPSQRDPETPYERDPLSTATAPVRTATEGAAGACEGEQWEGEDRTGVQGASLLNVEPSGVGVSRGSGPEPSSPDVMSNGAGDALHARASVGAGAYGKVAVWGGATVAASSDGRITAVYFRDETDKAVAAVGLVATWDEVFEAYEDANPTSPPEEPHSESTDGNVLWSFFHTAHVLRDTGASEEENHTDEGPCSQADYDAGTCTRDNTAVTFEVLA